MPLFELTSVLLSMNRPKQTPYDLILWTLASQDGKAEWIELRKRTKLKAAELGAALSKLVKDGRVSIISKGRSQIKPRSHLGRDKKSAIPV